MALRPTPLYHPCAMKIYTCTGDDGTTGLIGAQRVSKADPRVDCVGAVDELNAALGLAAAGASGEVLQRLREVQNDLFVVGAHLATPDVKMAQAALPALDQEHIARLEQEIDAADKVLPPLQQFILPGGVELAARLHLARTICRRAERCLVSFAQQHPVSQDLIVFLNRLSDWLFTYARLANHLAGEPDIPRR